MFPRTFDRMTQLPSGCIFSQVDVGEVTERVLVGQAQAQHEALVGFEDLDQGDRGALLDQLARGAAQGNRHALIPLIEIVDRYRLDRVPIRRILVDNEEVEEAHQDVLLAVAQSIGSFRGDAAFTTWLFAVARNTAAANLRRSRRTPEPMEDVDRPITGQRLSSMISSRADLQSAVEQLPAHYREAVYLRDIEQWPYERIAEHLAVPINTVKSRISRGRALVASALAEVR